MTYAFSRGQITQFTCNYLLHFCAVYSNEMLNVSTSSCTSYSLLFFIIRLKARLWPIIEFILWGNLALADFGHNPQGSESLRGRRNFFVMQIGEIVCY